MDKRREYQEVLDVIKIIMEEIKDAEKEIYSAKDWGVFDLLGGGFLASMVKRDKMKMAQYSIEKINARLKELSKELKDVDMSIESCIDTQDELFDVWLDNIFTDIRIQKNIEETAQSLGNLKNEIEKIQLNIEEKLKELT